MASTEEKPNLKRKNKDSLLPSKIKSEKLNDLNQSVRLLIQKIRKEQRSENNKTVPRIRRLLIRSLGSSNVQVQKNYFAVLVALMKSSETSGEFTVKHVWDTVESELHITGNLAKGEEGEILIGKILAFGVMVRSGCFSRCPADEQRAVLSQVIQDIKGKSYLPLIADPFLIQYLHQIGEPVFREVVWECLSREVEPGPSQSLLIYHILLVCAERFPSVLTTKYLKDTLNSAAILSTTTVPALFTTLKNNFKMKTINHTVYEDIFRFLANSPEPVLQCFWNAVERELLTDDATVANNKPIMGFKFFGFIVSNLGVNNGGKANRHNVSKVEMLLSPRVLSWLMKKQKISGKGQKLLNIVIKEALDKLYQLCAYEVKMNDISFIAPKVIPKLLLHPGNVLFEQLSGTKIVQQLISLLNEDQVVKFAESLQSVISGSSPVSSKKDGEGSTRPLYNKEKLHAVHLFCRLLSLSAVQSNLQWRLEQLIFLFDLGFFSTGNNVGVELASHVRDSFFNCLNHKLANLTILRNILFGIVGHINNRLQEGDELRIKVKSEVMPAWQKMCETAIKIGKSKKHKKQQWVTSIFQTMFYHIGLHLFKESAFATDILQELHSVYERVDSSASTKEEPHWTEVVVEMFLSLLSRNSHLHRHLIGCIFSHFCPIMIPQNIHQILQILDPTSNSNPLLDSLDPDSDSSSDVESDEDDGEEDKESSDDGMTEEEEEDDDEQDEKVNDKLRRAILDALGDAGAQTDVESVDLDEMDEEEGARVDRALSQAFKSVKPNSGKSKKQPSHAKALLHFRLRVLDLIEVWLASEPPLDLVIDTLLRLITLLEHSLVDRHQAPLETRLRSVIRKLTSIKKYKTSDCQALCLGTILKSLLERGERTTTIYMSVTKELTSSTLFIVKASQHFNETETNEEESNENATVLSVLKDIVKSFFLHRDCLLPVDLFLRLFAINLPSICEIASKLPKYVFDTNVHPFRRSKALEFMIIFWRSNRILSESNEEYTPLLKKMSKKLYKGSVNMIEEPTGRVQPKFMNFLRQSFNIIQKRDWLPDVDWPQHMQLLAQFQKTHVMKNDKKEKKLNGQKEAESNDDMEVENEPEESDKAEENSEEESSNEENPEPSSAQNSIVKPPDTKDEENDSGLDEASQLGSEEHLSDSEQPPSKKSKKTDKPEKKKSQEQIKRAHLLKSNSNKLRLQSMSVGLEENIFSKYNLLAKKSVPTSPDR